MASDKDVRYCHCGNVEIRDGIGGTSSGSGVRVRYTFLTEIRNDNGRSVLYCICCETNVVEVEGVERVADLDKVNRVTIMDSIEEKQLRAQSTYSDVFGVVLPPTKDADADATTTYPPQIQETLDSAVERQKNIMQAQINEFTATKKQEFKTWREEARNQAKLLANIAVSSFKPPSPSLTPSAAVRINSPSQSTPNPQNSELFQKSPVSQYSHPGASPLAAASLTRSFQERPVLPPSPPQKEKTPPIPLSSSLKSPGSSNYSKPVKRVMFQDPPDDEAHSDADDEDVFEEASEEPDIPSMSNSDATISVDDELFDFDETIPSIAVESDTTSSSLSPSPTQPVRSPLFAPPLSPFRRRSVEKYDLPGDSEDEEYFEDQIPIKLNGTAMSIITDELSSSKPIAITPPSRSFLSEGLGVEDEEDEGGMKGLIERISLKNTQSGRNKISFADQKLLWDIPGDYYRSVPS